MKKEDIESQMGRLIISWNINNPLNHYYNLPLINLIMSEYGTIVFSEDISKDKKGKIMIEYLRREEADKAMKEMKDETLCVK
jgi:hypothetical protein